MTENPGRVSSIKKASKERAEPLEQGNLKRIHHVCLLFCVILQELAEELWQSTLSGSIRGKGRRA